MVKYGLIAWKKCIALIIVIVFTVMKVRSVNAVMNAGLVLRQTEAEESKHAEHQMSQSFMQTDEEPGVFVLHVNIKSRS